MTRFCYLRRFFVGFAAIFSLRVEAKLDRSDRNWWPERSETGVELEKFSFLLRRVHVCTTSWGIFIYLFAT